MFVSLTRVCVVYVTKEVMPFSVARSINGRGHIKERTLKLYRSAEGESCVAYVEN